MVLQACYIKRLFGGVDGLSEQSGRNYKHLLISFHMLFLIMERWPMTYLETSGYLEDLTRTLSLLKDLNIYKLLEK